MTKEQSISLDKNPSMHEIDKLLEHLDRVKDTLDMDNMSVIKAIEDLKETLRDI